MCLMMLSAAPAAFAGPIRDGITRAAQEPVRATLADISMQETVIKAALPWGLRRAGAGVALTILGADVAIMRGGLKVSKSVTF